MSPLIGGITVLLWLLPIVFALLMLVYHQPLGFPLLVLLILYGGVWLGCRPSYFEISPMALTIAFPVWRRDIPLEDVTGTCPITQDRFQQEFGWAMRVGVGGLWGGFGWLWTARRRWLEFYISRSDGPIVIERKSGMPLLITPETPDQFATVMQAFHAA
jgi:hypothetical protein